MRITAAVAGTVTCVTLAVFLFVTPDFVTGNPSNRFIPRIIDGDTLSDGSTTYRLVGVDACELGQPVLLRGDKEPVDCGYYARAFVERFIGDDQVICYDQGPRSYGRIVARCFSGTVEAPNDIGAFAIRSGWAEPTSHAGLLYGVKYVFEHYAAKAFRRGAQNGTYENSAAWRNR